MSSVTEQLDGIMERASRALAEMDYLGCETLCEEALAEARAHKRYRYYARVLLPLQEARRQRRMTAAQGEVVLGSDGAGVDLKAWQENGRVGCLVLTQPNTRDEAKALATSARRANRFVEVLFADNARDAAIWTLRAYEGPSVSCEIDAPRSDQDGATWFLNATEQLGDAALASVDESLSGEALIDELATRLSVFPDHELLHQRLAEAARAVGASA